MDDVLALRIDEHEAVSFAALLEAIAARHEYRTREPVATPDPTIIHEVEHEVLFL